MTEIVEQLSLWGEMYPFFHFNDKPIILLEMFAGIGAQRKAFEILGVKIDDRQSKICEWAYNSYCAYNSIHLKDWTDYSLGKSKEELVKKVFGTSINYDEPLSFEQVNKKPLEWLKSAYNNIIATNNLVNIMEVQGKDLGELPSDQVSILTYSFPCQDLSTAGKLGGMSTSQKDGGTRSGLLWEVERILMERERDGLQLPTILMMENVEQVVGKNNIKHFKKWEQRLRQFGYSNYVDTLNGKNFGIPQSRKRCFMISILGEYAYDFPCKIKLRHKLRDVLENNVDEKYFLSDDFIDYASGVNYDNAKFNRTKMFISKLKTTNVDGIAGTITTREGGRSNDNFIVEDESLKKELCNQLIKDGLVKEGDIVKHSYTSQIMNGKKKAVETSDEMITLTTRGDCLGVVVDDNKIMSIKNLRIRKLTPKECMRLMGFADSDTQALRDIDLSDAAIYHVAGDSIITTCLVALFSSFVNNKNEHISIIEKYVEENIVEKRR